jgi:hypothetical protein
MDSAYRSFVGVPDSDDSDLEIVINLEIGCRTDIDHWEKIFDSESSWSMFKNNGTYCITMKPKTFDRAVWQAVIKPGFTEATVFCCEQLVQTEAGQKSIYNPVCYPLDQILLMYILGPRQGSLLHAAGAVLGNGKGVLFPGKSGAGKSTIANLIAADRQKWLLSDDRVIIRKKKETFTAHGTPWPGEAGIAENRASRIAAILFLKQAAHCQIKKLEGRQAFASFFPIVSMPWYDREILLNMMTFCEETISEIPCYEFSFTPGMEAVQELSEFSTGIA